MIAIDSRVGSAELDVYFKKLGYPHRLEQLKYGDFAFNGNGPNSRLIRVAVERKTWPDFLNSVASGRFSGDQLIGLIENYDDVYLYLEGAYRCNPDSTMFEYKNTGSAVWTTGYGKPLNWHFVMAKILSFEHCGLRVVYTHDPEDTARRVGSAYTWYSKLWEEHNSHRQIKNIKFDVQRATKVARVARALGLGHIAARKAEAAFKSNREMIMATTDDWIRHGIVASRAQATKIWNMCN